MARPQACLTRTPTYDELRELRRRVAARGIPRRDHQRAAIVLELVTRRLRREPGLEHIDPTTVRRFFVEAGLSCQADRSFCASTDPKLAEKARSSRTPMPR